MIYEFLCTQDPAMYWILAVTLLGVLWSAWESRRIANEAWSPRFGIGVRQLPITGRTERDPNTTQVRVSLGWYSPYPIEGRLEVWEIENQSKVKLQFRDRFIFWAGDEHVSRDFAIDWDPPKGTLIRIKVIIESSVPTGRFPYQKGVDYRRLDSYLTDLNWQGPYPPDGLGGASRGK